MKCSHEKHRSFNFLHDQHITTFRVYVIMFINFEILKREELDLVDVELSNVVVNCNVQKEAETNLPILRPGERIKMSMVDIDTLETWDFNYRSI